MKRRLLILLAVVILLLPWMLVYPPTSNFAAHYRGGPSYSPEPTATLLSSKQELDAFMLQHNILEIEYDETFRQYNSWFFHFNQLIIVSLSEGSSSVTHKVQSVDSQGNVVIQRRSPAGMHTADVTNHWIIIEVSQSPRLKECSVSFVTTRDNGNRNDRGGSK